MLIEEGEAVSVALALQIGKPSCFCRTFRKTKFIWVYSVRVLDSGGYSANCNVLTQQTQFDTYIIEGTANRNFVPKA